MNHLKIQGTRRVTQQVPCWGPTNTTLPRENIQSLWHLVS